MGGIYSKLCVRIQGKRAIVFVFDAANEDSVSGRLRRCARCTATTTGAQLEAAIRSVARCCSFSCALTQESSRVVEAKSVVESLGVADGSCHVQPIDAYEPSDGIDHGLRWIRERLSSTKSAVRGKSMAAVEIRKKQEPHHEVQPPIIS